MSVPTTNLYDYIYHNVKSQMIMRYFYPFGEKDLQNCISKNSIDIQDKDLSSLFCDNIFFQKKLPDTFIDYVPLLICHDQEPLNFELYNANNTASYVNWYNTGHKRRKGFTRYIENQNLRMVRPADYHKKIILLHSEKNGEDIEKYLITEEYELAYCWTNALLSLDWFRYAEYDPSLHPSSNIRKTFLTYSRTSSGLRSYRKIFKNLINENQLTDFCQWTNFSDTSVTSESSASYSSKDINQTMLSVVLETVYDQRIHLTEKTLRPIACGHPFMLVSGPGSLAYLQSYGFKTFHPYINESYDLENDNNKRMSLIVNEMKRINNLSEEQKNILTSKLLQISKYNKKLFFSKKFNKKILNEMNSNIQTAYKKVVYQLCWKRIWKQYKEYKKYRPNLLTNNNKKLMITLVRHLKKGGTLENYVPPELD